MIGTLNGTDFNVRLTPSLSDNNILGLTGSLIPSNVPIYGWSDINPSIDTPYWLLIGGNQNLLVWVAPSAVSHNQNVLNDQNKIPNTDVENLSPVAPH